jgi:hypothetical protein
VFCCLSQQLIAPFLEEVVVYLRSAIAHPTPSLRLDAMAALRLVIEAYPTAIGPRLPELYQPLFQLLSSPSAAGGGGSGGGASQGNQLERRAAMLQTLLLTLQCAACPSPGTKSTYGNVRRGCHEVDVAVAAAVRVEAFVPGRKFDDPRLWSGSTAAVAVPLVHSVASGSRGINDETAAHVPVRGLSACSHVGHLFACMADCWARASQLLLQQLWQVWLECCPSDWSQRRRYARNLLLVVRLLLQLFRPNNSADMKRTGQQPKGLGLRWPPNFPTDVRRYLLVHCPMRLGNEGGSSGGDNVGGKHAVEQVPERNRGDMDTVDTVLTAVDVAICELVLLISAESRGAAALTAAERLLLGRSAPDNKHLAQVHQPAWKSRVFELVVQLMRDRSMEMATALRGVVGVRRAADLGASAGASSSVSYDTGGALVRVSRALLHQLDADTTASPVGGVLSIALPTASSSLAPALWDGCTQLFHRAKASDAVKRQMFEFFAAAPDTVPAPYREKWLRVLCKLLCDLRTLDAGFTTAILSLLLHCLRRRRCSASDGGAVHTIEGCGNLSHVGATIEESQAGLTPFFYYRGTTRGQQRRGSPGCSDGHATTSQRYRELPGPFTQFQSPKQPVHQVQARAIELLFYLHRPTLKLLYAAVRACQTLPHRPGVSAYLLDTLASRKPPLNLPQIFTVLLSLSAPDAASLTAHAVAVGDGVEADSRHHTTLCEDWGTMVVGTCSSDTLSGPAVRWAASMREHWTGATLLAVVEMRAATILMAACEADLSAKVRVWRAYRAAAVLEILTAAGGSETTNPLPPGLAAAVIAVVPVVMEQVGDGENKLKRVCARAAVSASRAYPRQVFASVVTAAANECCEATCAYPAVCACLCCRSRLISANVWRSLGRQSSRQPALSAKMFRPTIAAHDNSSAA